MALKARILGENYLILFEVSLKGGTEHRRFNLTTEREGDSERSEWEALRIVKSRPERDEGEKIRNKAARELAMLGARTPVGILVPETMLGPVEGKYLSVKETFAEYNRRARYSRLEVFLELFKVQSDNVRTCDRLIEDLRGLLHEMRQAVEDAEPTSLREVVRKLNGFSDVLVPEIARPVQEAIEHAKEAARELAGAQGRTIEEYEAALRRVSFTPVDLALFALEEAMPAEGGPVSGAQSGFEL